MRKQSKLAAATLKLGADSPKVCSCPILPGPHSHLVILLVRDSYLFMEQRLGFL